VPAKGTANYVRHAVAVDECRVKFKPALFVQDIRATADIDDEDIKEVWFPGCHGDVGGGWPAVQDSALDTVRETDKTKKLTLWVRVKNLFTTRKPLNASKDVRNDPFQMSDIPLAWMINELELIAEKDGSAAIQFSKNLAGFKHQFEKKKQQALTGVIHNSLKFGYGTGFFTVLLWKFMGECHMHLSCISFNRRPKLTRAEYLPFISRWELEDNAWVKKRFPLNGGGTRDIPEDAVLHESLIWRLKNIPSYNPGNNHGGAALPCLKHQGTVAPVYEESSADGQSALSINQQAKQSTDHRTYRLKPKA
jgi:hypothetical protein